MVLYGETNLLVGHATGRDPEVEALLASSEPLTLAIPSLCVMEALTWLEGERKRRNRLADTFNEQLGELKRDLTSESAAEMANFLSQTVLKNTNVLNDVERRLFRLLNPLRLKIANTVAVEWLPLTLAALRRGMNTTLLREPTDNLIAACIISDAYNRDDEKCFVSANTTDFTTPRVRAVMENADIRKQFRTVGQFLQWRSSNSRQERTQAVEKGEPQ